MKGIIKLAKAFNVAFSMYSKVPMPRFEWASEDMEYHLCFFPFVGVFLAGMEGIWWYVVTICDLPMGMRNAGFLAILLAGTGGFHVDGFMDTVDARCSYQSREKKLEILKDPHIGAFSVIRLALVGLLAFGGLYKINDVQSLWAAAGILVLSRIGSGLCVMSLPSAKDKGMLKTTMDTASSRVKAVLVVEGILAMGLLLWIARVKAVVEILTWCVILFFFARMCKKEFGGITGDLAGYFVVVAEVFGICALCVYEMIKGVSGL